MKDDPLRCDIFLFQQVLVSCEGRLVATFLSRLARALPIARIVVGEDRAPLTVQFLKVIPCMADVLPVPVTEKDGCSIGLRLAEVNASDLFSRGCPNEKVGILLAIGGSGSGKEQAIGEATCNQAQAEVACQHEHCYPWPWQVEDLVHDLWLSSIAP